MNQIYMKKKGRKKSQYNVIDINNISFKDDEILVLHIPISSDFTKKKQDIKSISLLTESEDDLSDLLLNKDSSYISINNHNEKKNKHILSVNTEKIFLNYNNDFITKYPEKSGDNCWWCRHTFQNIPIFLPTKYQNNVFYCTGLFCSFNCCKAYLFDSPSHDSWKLNSLLNFYFKKLTGSINDIKIAPSWKLLKKYGGNLTIKEFRKNYNTNLTYHLNNLNIFVQNEVVSKEYKKINSTSSNNKKTYKIKRTKSLIKKGNNLNDIIDII